MTNSSKTLVTLIVVVAAVIVLYAVLTVPDQRTTTERIGDAIHELPNGADKAARQLEKRTPGEKLGDAVKDVGNDIKRNTDGE